MRWLALPALAGLVASVAFLTDVGSAAPPARTATLWVGPSGWDPGTSRVEYGGVGVGQFFCESSPNIEGNAGFSLPVDLPTGSRITKATVYHRDLDPDFDLVFTLGFSSVGVSDILDESTEVRSDEAQPPVATQPSELQSIDLALSAPVTVDRTTRDYSVFANFEACRLVTDANNEQNPSLVLDGVKVEYTPPR